MPQVLPYPRAHKGKYLLEGESSAAKGFAFFRKDLLRVLTIEGNQAALRCNEATSALIECMGGGQLNTLISDFDADSNECAVGKDELPIRSDPVGREDLGDLVEESVRASVWGRGVGVLEALKLDVHRFISTEPHRGWEELDRDTIAVLSVRVATDEKAGDNEP